MGDSFCGRSEAWHADHGYDTRGHYPDLVNWCPGRAPQPGRPELYTMEDAIVLGRRALCENSDGGHQIERTLEHRISNVNGTMAWDGYGCTCCDLVVTTSYPELPSRRRQGSDG